MKFGWLGLVAAGMIAAAGATPSSAAPRPKLLVVISVDQFSADLYAQYRSSFTAGLKRLGTGAVFPSGYQSHAATETCPGHSTILTGSHPARTGIIANNWYDLSLPRADKLVYCAEDPAVPGSTSRKYEPSPIHLRVPTLGDRMKAAGPADRVVSVAGKDRAAIMMGGHMTDQIWFWSDDRYRTLADHAGPVPAAVTAANARATAMLAKPATIALPPHCAGVSHAIAVGTGSVGTLAVRIAGDRSAYRATPAFDTATTDLAIAMLQEERLGRGAGTDLLIVGLSATDYVGHAYGNEGAEMCAQMAGLDGNIGRLLTALDKVRVPYAVALTADHGGHDVPERAAIHAEDDAVRVDPALSPAALDKAVRAEFGLTGRALWADGPSGDLYIDRGIARDLRPRIISSVRARLLAHPQVEAVFTAADLTRGGRPALPADEWTLAERARASFDPARSGDLYVMLKPHVISIAEPGKGYATTHGSVWNYDRRVPMLFWWPGMAGFEQPIAVETVDILPTLAGLIGLSVPADQIDGRCLDLDPGPASTCKALVK